MDICFRVTNKDRTVLVVDGKIIKSVDEINGYEYLRLKLVDTIVDNINIAEADKMIETNPEPKVLEIKTDKTKYGLYNDSILIIVIVIPWIMGTVIATSWFKLLAIFFPPYAIYLTTEVLMKFAKII